MRRVPWAVFALTAVALALRLTGLARESVWIDEAFTVNSAHQSLAAILAAAKTDVHPPLYALFMHFWVSAFGSSEFALRLPSVIFGVIAIPLAMRLARRLFGEAAANATGLLAATSVFALHYSQEARNYSLMALLTLASMDFYVSIIERFTVRVALGYAAVTIALVYTHHFGWFALLAQDVHALVLATSDGARRAWFARWVGLQFVVALAFAPWIPVLAGQIHHASDSFWAVPPTALTLAKLAWEYAGSAPLLLFDVIVIAFALVFTRRGLAPQATQAGASAEAAAQSGAATSGMPLAKLLVASWAVLPIAVPFALSRAGFGVFLTRMTLSSCFAFLMIAGWALSRLPHRRALAIAFVALSVPALAGYFRDTHKEPWREAVANLEHEARAGDLVVVHAGYNLGTSYRYYAKRRDLALMPINAGGDSIAAEALPALRDSLRSHDRAWLVLSRSDDHAGALRAAMADGRRLAAHEIYRIRSYEPSHSRDFVGIETFRFDASPN
jgi:mannosyltransferase